MKQLLQSPLLAALLISPCAVALIALEAVHVIPARQTPRLVVLRRILWVVSVVLLTALGALILARFADLSSTGLGR